MNLTDLIKSDSELPVNGVTSDSRRVQKNYLFAALPGSKTSGSDYIADAIQHGARYILAGENVKLPENSPDDVVLINDNNPRKAFAQLVAKFYRLQPDHIVAVTGTSGKTSTVSFVQQLWHLSGIENCASLGTLGVRGPGLCREGKLTTPDTASLHAELADLKAAGIEHLAMEASSHGLDQYRLDGVQISAAAYTNLSRDHLDYHKDMDDYFQAKERLFTDVMPEGRVAVVNADDEYASRLIESCEKKGHRVLTYGESGSFIKLLSRDPSPSGQQISIEVDSKNYNLTLPLVGDFQVLNALCALGLVLSLGADQKKFVPLIEKLTGVPGRLQLVPGHVKGAVYVDYAHKPAALETILNTLRPHTSGKLVCVFGCGGNRDPGKRPIMGQIASELADKVIVTDDNPRYEDAQEIRKQILDAAPNAVEVTDRAEAIKQSVSDLGKGDVLVIAGKGHESGQIVGEEVFPFNDYEEVEKAIHESGLGESK